LRTRLRFLLDTNIVSEAIRSRPNPMVMHQLREYEAVIATATVVWHELWYGCYRLPSTSNKRQILEAYLTEEVSQKIPLLPYDAESAFWFAQERARLVSLGKTPSFADGQIAAIAQVNNLILVTNNVSDFSDFHNLQLENWFS
jgi:tRNA(fMet)-specific endonuclease VapC